MHAKKLLKFTGYSYFKTLMGKQRYYINMVKTIYQNVMPNNILISETMKVFPVKISFLCLFVLDNLNSTNSRFSPA